MWELHSLVETSWNVMAHCGAREGKWRGIWRMEWVNSKLYTTLEHGVSRITTADAHTSAASSRLNWRPPGRFKWTRPFRPKDVIWFLRVCHHISTGLYCWLQEVLQSIVWILWVDWWGSIDLLYIAVTRYYLSLLFSALFCVYWGDVRKASLALSF